MTSKKDFFSSLPAVKRAYQRWATYHSAEKSAQYKKRTYQRWGEIQSPEKLGDYKDSKGH